MNETMAVWATGQIMPSSAIPMTGLAQVVRKISYEILASL